MKLSQMLGLPLLFPGMTSHVTVANAEVVAPALPGLYSYRIIHQPKFLVRKPSVINYPLNPQNAAMPTDRRADGYLNEGEKVSCSHDEITFDGEQLLILGLRCHSEANSVKKEAEKRTVATLDKPEVTTGHRSATNLRLPYIEYVKFHFQYQNGKPVFTEENRVKSLAKLKEQLLVFLSKPIQEERFGYVYKSASDANKLGKGTLENVFWEGWGRSQREYLFQVAYDYISSIYNDEKLFSDVVTKVTAHFPGLPFYGNGPHELVLEAMPFVFSTPPKKENVQYSSWSLHQGGEAPVAFPAGTGENLTLDLITPPDRAMINLDAASMSAILNQYICSIKGDAIELTKEDAAVFARFDQTVEANKTYLAHVTTEGPFGAKVRSWASDAGPEAGNYLDVAAHFYLQNKNDPAEKSISVDLVFVLKVGDQTLVPQTTYAGKNTRDANPNVPALAAGEKIVSPIADTFSKFALKTLTSLSPNQMLAAKKDAAAPGAYIVNMQNILSTGLGLDEAGTRVGKYLTYSIRINPAAPQPKPELEAPKALDFE